MKTRESLALIFTILLVTAGAGCSQSEPTSDKPANGHSYQDSLQNLDMNQIAALIDEARKFRMEQLAPFDLRWMDESRKLSEEKMFAQEIFYRLQSKLDDIRQRIGDLKARIANPESPASDLMNITAGSFSFEQQLKIAEAAEAILAIENDVDRKAAIDGAAQ